MPKDILHFVNHGVTFTVVNYIGSREETEVFDVWLSMNKMCVRKKGERHFQKTTESLFI